MVLTIVPMPGEVLASSKARYCVIDRLARPSAPFWCMAGRPWPRVSAVGWAVEGRKKTLAMCEGLYWVKLLNGSVQRVLLLWLASCSA